jgi:putative OmpL-like beta-barrel porin-2
MNATSTNRIAAISSVMFLSTCALAQQSSEIRPKPSNATVVPNAVLTPAAVTPSEPTERERLLVDRIEKLERRLVELESRSQARTIRDPLQPASTNAVAGHSAEDVSKTRPDNTAPETQEISKEDRAALDFPRDTTFNVTIDGYYGYNFNKPIGRVNLVRAYDVQSNSFSLNQATIVIERTPNLETGRRFGARLDLMYGQATETVQGNAANEPRPQAYRPVWQAFGTYVAPIGKGLTLDFGKFASSLGFETNYTKDNYNYSRSYYFTFLPFYHTGVRAKYPVNDRVTVIYHLINGIQQLEDFNGFKSQHFALILTPVKQLAWQVNYYVGQEQRDLLPELNPGVPSLPTQPGLSTNLIRPVPNGRLHIIDTYATWNATGNLTLAVEGDYVVNRAQDVSAPAHISGGVGYARYQFTPKFALAGRAEYLSDRGGLFSGVTQALKETTLTSEFKLADGFLVRAEWRRDFSNQPFFLTDAPAVLKKEQNTASLGLIWWFGRKEGSW